MNFIENTFIIYVITFLITISHAMAPFRKLARKALCKIGFNFAVLHFEDLLIEDDVVPDGIADYVVGYDFISCRMCVGAWVALALSLWTGDFVAMVVAYGASYFLATQERP